MRELSQKVKWIKRHFIGITEIAARKSLQIMNPRRDEKLSLNYYSTGSLNQWRAKNDYSGPLIFTYQKSTWCLFNSVLPQAIKTAFCFFISKQRILLFKPRLQSVMAADRSHRKLPSSLTNCFHKKQTREGWCPRDTPPYLTLGPRCFSEAHCSFWRSWILTSFSAHQARCQTVSTAHGCRLFAEPEEQDGSSFLTMPCDGASSRPWEAHVSGWEANSRYSPFNLQPLGWRCQQKCQLMPITMVTFLIWAPTHIGHQTAIIY